MKKVLIISPFFPPSNTADMQRIRMSLPYFTENNWLAEVVTVNAKYSDSVKDELLEQSIPNDIKIHYVNALSKKITSKVGLGSMALRSMLFYLITVNRLLKNSTYDLIYFSTTEFPLCILGTYWKRKFGIPFVIDMQDPWHNNFYEDKPKNQRPKKYWFSYNLHKYLEPIAMWKVDGIISVSKKYIDTLQERYQHISEIPTQVITFGANGLDFEIAKQNEKVLKLYYKKSLDIINLVYVGRGGHDMNNAIMQLFQAFKLGLAQYPHLFEKTRFHFIGTSYAAKGTGTKTIYPTAERLGIEKQVFEYTDRIGFYEGLHQLLQADGVFIIGSNDPKYTASKLYPYIMAKKPLLSIFHIESSATRIIKECNAGHVISLDQEVEVTLATLKCYLKSIVDKTQIKTNFSKFTSFSAANMTTQQTKLFEKVVAQPASADA